MKAAKALDGIIAHLTKKHGGNVQEKGIVRFTSKSVADDLGYALVNVSDLTDSSFISKKFFERTGQVSGFAGISAKCTSARLTKPSGLATEKSRVVEGSVDGSRWREIGRQTRNQNFKYDSVNTVSFAVSSAAELHSIPHCLPLSSSGRFGRIQSSCHSVCAQSAPFP
jgi:hypothetical protein